MTNHKIRAILERVVADVDDRMEFAGTVWKSKSQAEEGVLTALDKAEQQLEDYFLELVGEDTSMNNVERGLAQGWVAGQNQLRAELRQAIKEGK
jgi:hypothetical protein